MYVRLTKFGINGIDALYEEVAQWIVLSAIHIQGLAYTANV